MGPYFLCILFLLLFHNFPLLILFIIFIPRASAVFVGIYEPIKQKLLKVFPENLSALAHLVSEFKFKYNVFCIDALLENVNQMFKKILMSVTKDNFVSILQTRIYS